MQTTDVPLVLDLQFRGFVTGSTIRSKLNGEELCKYFGGIPFALPPVGAFRFLRPRPLPSCYRYGTRANPGVYTRKCGVCPQAKSSKLEDEDCLQLNIFIPSGPPPGEGWPVYFYIRMYQSNTIENMLIGRRWGIPPIWECQ
jgi:carboxylesterase type B